MLFSASSASSAVGKMQIPILKSLLHKSFDVIPAKAGIQVCQGSLDPGFRRGDGSVEFCKSLSIYHN
jgi:hypothetical protein